MSDAQQHCDAAQKESFQENLPQRVAAVQRRLRALCEGGWDINTLHLTFLEVQNLAASSDTYGMADVSSRLFKLERCLGSFLQTGGTPDDAQADDIRLAITTLDDYSADSDVSGRRASPTAAWRARITRAQQLPAPALDGNGLPLLSNIPALIRPPPDFIRMDGANDGADAAAVGDLQVAAGRTHPNASTAIDEAAAESFDDEPELELMVPLDDLEDWDSSEFNFDDHLDDDLALLTGADSEPAGDDRLPDVDTAPVPDDGQAGDAPMPEGDLSTAGQDPADQDLAAAVDELEAELGLGGAENADDPFENLDALFEEIESVVSDDSELPSGQQAAEAATQEDAASAFRVGARGRLSIYVLHGGGETTRRLQTLLDDDYDVQAFQNAEEFLEILSAIGPDAVILDDAHLDRVEEIGRIVRKLRNKTHGPLPLIALSTQRDVATRLKLMRAGADAYLPASAAVDELAGRVRELLHASPEEAYRILIVEDDRSQALFAQSILKRAGLEARIERDPLKVLEVMEEFLPDLVLMDLHMPDCDGLELTSIVRERDEFINTPIVFLSGEDDEDTHFDALLAGGDDFLSKPIRPRHLISAVKNRVRRARSSNRQARETAAEPQADSLTGLVDRPLLIERINHALTETQPDDDRAGGVIYFEMDRPLDIRRQLGLSAFESLGTQLGPLVTENLREEDTAARYGDNAYCLLVPGRSLSALERRAQATLDQVSEHVFGIDDGQARLTISAGICPLSTRFADAATVIGNAEQVCNAQSDQELRRLATYRLNEADEHIEVREIGELIAEALDEDRFEMVYQPIATLQGDEIEQYQCLLRLPRPGMPAMSPAQVLEAADQLGMMAQIDRWVLSKGLSVVASSGDRERPLRLFINQSVEATRDEEMADWLIKSLEERDIPGSALVLEFKLPEIIGALKPTVALIDQLSTARIRFCLGSFDGSDTAFQVLEHVAAEFVKLAPGFVRDNLTEARLTDVITRLHQANARIIVPAVEEAETAIQLWSSGVDYLQGNFIQQPDADLKYQFANAI